MDDGETVSRMSIHYTPETRLFLVDGLSCGPMSKTLGAGEKLKAICDAIATGLVKVGVIASHSEFMKHCTERFSHLADWDSN